VAVDEDVPGGDQRGCFGGDREEAVVEPSSIVDAMEDEIEERLVDIIVIEHEEALARTWAR
tara:strand:+ start:251 stop:433 length:183 start_codon:yes stop_codon:yes gene_type:complete